MDLPPTNNTALQQSSLRKQMKILGRKELEELTPDELTKIYKEQKLYKQEYEYLREYFCSSSDLSNAPVVQSDESLTMAEKIRILKKLKELIEIKYNASGIEKRVLQLECEKESLQQLAEIVCKERLGDLDYSKAEVVQKFLLEEDKRRNNLLDTLALRVATLRKQIVKQQKAIMAADGEGSRSVMDYHSLCIENGEYQRTIAQITLNLSNAKNDMAKLSTQVNRVKQELSASLKQQAEYEKNLKTMVRVEEKLKDEIKGLQENLIELKKEVQETKAMSEEWETPEVFEYIKACQDVRKLEKAKKVYEYKVGLLKNNKTKH